MVPFGLRKAAGSLVDEQGKRCYNAESIARVFLKDNVSEEAEWALGGTEEIDRR